MQLIVLMSLTCFIFAVAKAGYYSGMFASQRQRLKPPDKRKSETTSGQTSGKTPGKTSDQLQQLLDQLDENKSICFHGKAVDKLLKLIEERELEEHPIDCGDIDKTKGSGVYKVYPKGYENTGFDVYCDMKTDNGGWTVFQRRVDGTENFYREWDDYKEGFGDLSANFWLGNSKIHAIASQARYELRIDLQDFEGNKRHAKYSYFSIDDESDKYKLTLGTYTGDAGDSFSYQKGSSFTTKDSDNDADGKKNCAIAYKGAWWYKNCHQSNLNGLYLNGHKMKSYADGIIWYTWKGYRYSLKSTKMMIRRSNQ